MKKIVIGLLFISLVIGGTTGCNKESTPKAKYVFFFIGDGMGLNQVYLAELYKASLEGKIGNSPLNLSQLPIQSYMTTYSANHNITCSSASATAMATGYKTNNGVVCKDTSLTIKYETIAEKVKAAGYEVGVLSSVGIDHATPACFYAHQDSRNMYYEISLELAESKFDYFGGGGFHYPTGEEENMTNAYDKASELGYKVSKNIA